MKTTIGNLTILNLGNDREYLKTWKKDGFDISSKEVILTKEEEKEVKKYILECQYENIGSSEEELLRILRVEEDANSFEEMEEKTVFNHTLEGNIFSIFALFHYDREYLIIRGDNENRKRNK